MSGTTQTTTTTTTPGATVLTGAGTGEGDGKGGATGAPPPGDKTKAPETGAGAGATGNTGTTQTPEEKAAAEKAATDKAAADKAAADKKTADDKAAADKAAADKAGELELKIPDGVQVDAEALKSFKEIAKQHGIKAEAAQAIVDLQLKAGQEIQKKQALAAEQQQKEWSEKFKNDPELGGAKLAETNKNLAKAMKAYATPEFRAWLDESGQGDNPEVIRVFNRIGKAMAEDRIGDLNGGGPTVDPSKQALKERYPNTKFPDQKE